MKELLEFAGKQLLHSCAGYQFTFHDNLPDILVGKAWREVSVHLAKFDQFPKAIDSFRLDIVATGIQNFSRLPINQIGVLQIAFHNIVNGMWIRGSYYQFPDPILRFDWCGWK